MPSGAPPSAAVSRCAVATNKVVDLEAILVDQALDLLASRSGLRAGIRDRTA